MTWELFQFFSSHYCNANAAAPKLELRLTLVIKENLPHSPPPPHFILLSNLPYQTQTIEMLSVYGGKVGLILKGDHMQHIERLKAAEN